MSIHQLAAYPLDRITIPTCCHTRSMMAGEQYMRQVELPIETLPYIARQKVRTGGRQRHQRFDHDMPRAAVSRGCASDISIYAHFSAQPPGGQTGSSSLTPPTTTQPARPRGANSAVALGRSAGSPIRPPASQGRRRSSGRGLACSHAGNRRHRGRRHPWCRPVP